MAGEPYDVAIVGGGHNGLVCACYLAAAGLRVRVLERREVVGGAAVTEEFHPGFRNSAASYTVSLLHPKVIADLDLATHGLRIVARPMANFSPLPDGRHLSFGPTPQDTLRSVGAFSQRDASALPTFEAMLAGAANLVRETVLSTPPNVGGDLRDVLGALRLANKLRRLEMPARRDLLDLMAKSAGDLLDTWFEGDALKGALGFDAVVGTFASPYEAGTGYVLLHHVFGEVNGRRGAWGHAIGGMGAITQAMASEARRRGVEITTGTPVARVRVRAGRADGVVLADGTEIAARSVAANVNPKLLFLELVEAGAIDDEFRRRIEAYRCGSASFRMNVALSELPDFVASPGRSPMPHHGAGIYVCPSLGYMERAYFEARERGFSRAPIVEMAIPSVLDDSLAPAGAHVASLFCQHFAPELPGGASWDDVRPGAVETVIDAVDAVAPNFRRSILAVSARSPLDLERDFGLTGGDIFHGRLSMDQIFSARPVLGHGDYRLPVRGLYLCGSGAHPGGGVSGLPGHNAAREIARDLRGGALAR